MDSIRALTSCPYCGSAIGQKCTDPKSPKLIVLGFYHIERILLADQIMDGLHPQQIFE